MSYDGGDPGRFGPGFDFQGSGNLNPDELAQFMDSYGNDIIQNNTESGTGYLGGTSVGTGSTASTNFGGRSTSKPAGSRGTGNPAKPAGPHDPGEAYDQEWPPSVAKWLILAVIAVVLVFVYCGAPDYSRLYNPIIGFLHSSDAGSTDSMIEYEDAGVKYRIPSTWVIDSESFNPPDKFERIYYQKEFWVRAKKSINYATATVTIREQGKIKDQDGALPELAYYQKHGCSGNYRAISIPGVPFAYRYHLDLDSEIEGTPKNRTDVQTAFIGDLAIEIGVRGTTGFLRGDIVEAILSSIDYSDFDPSAFG